MIHLHQVEQGSLEWLERRADSYTGSNAYKLLTPLGQSEYAKAGRSNFKGNFWTKRGHVLEDEAIELYEAITGEKVDRPGFVTNDKYPGCLFSPDGLVLATKKVIEVKSFSERQHMKLVRGDIDVKIIAQIQYGLTITEFAGGVLLAYNPKMANVRERLAIIPVPRNKNTVKNFQSILTRKVAA